MKTKILGAVLLFTVCAYSAKINNLYSDKRAMQEGDLLTVLIVENAKAGSNSTTKTGNSNTAGINGKGGTGALDFIPSFGFEGGSGSSYEGNGDTQREGNFVATISVKIDKVFDNGNLLISGDKIVEINEEKEVIRITGLVRPQDIMAGNTIYSYNIASAEITYAGHGVNSDAQRPGPIARFFNWLF